jgi:hypothetical protein
MFADATVGARSLLEVRDDFADESGQVGSCKIQRQLVDQRYAERLDE